MSLVTSSLRALPKSYEPHNLFFLLCYKQPQPQQHNLQRDLQVLEDTLLLASSSSNPAASSAVPPLLPPATFSDSPSTSSSTSDGQRNNQHRNHHQPHPNHLQQLRVQAQVRGGGDLDNSVSVCKQITIAIGYL